MSTIKLQFHSIEEIQKFVQTVESYPAEMDLLCGSKVIDAKSLLGVLSFGINKVLDLKVNSDSCDELMKELQYCCIK